jgi:potassium-dependent mechanosensitive channel
MSCRRSHYCSAWVGRGWRALLLTLTLGLLLAAGPAAAQQPDPTDEALAAARQQMDGLQKQLAAGATLESLSALRSQTIALQSSASDTAAALAPQFANVEARLAELGAAPAAAEGEPSDIAAQRSSLAEQRTRLDAQLRLARLMAIESGQAAEQIDNLRRERFQAQLGERATSMLELSFWTELHDSWPNNARRLRAVAHEAAAAASSTAGWRWVLAIGLAATAVALLNPALRLLLKIASTRVPAGRLRRSLLALGSALLPPCAALLATQALRLGFGGGAGKTSPTVDSLLLGGVAAVPFGTYVAALGRALMSPGRPSWRLPPLPDLMATRLRHVPLLLGTVIAIGWMLERLAELINADLATEVAIKCLFSLTLGLLLVRTIRRSEHLRRQVLASSQAAQVPPRSLWQLAIAVAGWSALAVSIGCLLIGYVALGSLVIKQLAWIVIVGASAYLLASFVDDAFTSWLGTAPATQAAEGAGKAVPARHRQATVLLSAGARIVLGLVALGVVLGPLGQGPLEMLERAGSLREGIAIGEIRLLPGAVLHALLVLALGVAAVRFMQRWLLEHYLPTTALDEGMRTSMVTLLGYAGLVVAAALALSAIGLGLERVAWVASALSVGIGFGLQAVVQNFVSGLILLTERPVKVGDWVALGGIEGDIRRINVRATEIQTGDRSTVIVPNSEFITKVVRNVTHANPLGLVQIKLPMPADTDAEQVRTLLLAALQAHADVLDAPAPNVLLDAVDSGDLLFNATGSVASPRQAASVKSALLFDILARLKAAGLSLSRPPTMLLREEVALNPKLPGPAPGGPLT